MFFPLIYCRKLTQQKLRVELSQQNKTAVISTHVRHLQCWKQKGNGGGNTGWAQQTNQYLEKVCKLFRFKVNVSHTTVGQIHRFLSDFSPPDFWVTFHHQISVSIFHRKSLNLHTIHYVQTHHTQCFRSTSNETMTIFTPNLE